MKYRFKIGFLLLLMFFGCVRLRAQSDQIYEIKVLCCKNEKVNLIRWTIMNPQHLFHANKLGFNIERAELGSHTYIKLNKLPIKAPSVDVINRLDTNSVLFKTAVYTTLQPDPSTRNGNRNDSVLNMMYFMQASINFEAACFAGVGFKDTTIIPGKKYLYKVSIANAGKLKQSSELVATMDSVVNMKPTKLTAVFKNGAVDLSWDCVEARKNKFNIFIIERAEDGDTYKPIRIPYLQNIIGKEKTIYTDSIENYIHYNYRYRLMNYFGKMTEPSNVISGVAHEFYKK